MSARAAPESRALPTRAQGPLLAGEIQGRLVEYYRLGVLPAVEPFMRSTAEAAREQVVLRQAEDDLELAVELPAPLVALPAGLLRLGPARWAAGAGGVALDDLCQVLEAVSHFVLIADRARRDRPMTQFELELQAELDKYVLLTVVHRSATTRARMALRRRLFHQVAFVDPPGTIRGDRYRLAHRLAWRLTGGIERRFLREARYADLRVLLRRFHQAGQADKIALVRAA